MNKKALISLIPLVALMGGCRKSEKPFQAPEGYQQVNPAQPGTDGTRRQQGTDGQAGTDHQGAQEGGMMGREGGMMGREGGMMGREGGNAQGGTAQGEVYNNQVPEAIRLFRQDADQVRSSTDYQHTQLVSAFRNLATAIDGLPNAGTAVKDQSTRIRAYADRIEASGPKSNMHARWAKRALKDGADAVAGYAKDENVQGINTQLTAMRASIDKISDEKPFLQQREGFSNAMTQLADSLAFVSVPKPAGTK